MDIVNDFIFHTFRKYNFDQEYEFIYMDLRTKLIKEFETTELEINYNNLMIVFNSLGGNEFILNQYIRKYDLGRFYVSFTNFNAALVILIPAFLIVLFVFTAISSFTGGGIVTKYNVPGDFLGLYDTNFFALSFLYNITRLSIYSIGTIILLSFSRKSSFYTIFISIIVGLLSFPFGLILIVYAWKRFKYTNLKISLSKKLIFIASGVAALLIITLSQVALIPFRDYDQSYEKPPFVWFTTSGRKEYRTDLSNYSITPDKDYLEIDNSYFALQIKDDVVSGFGVRQINIDTQNLPEIKLGSDVTYKYEVNQYDVCTNKTLSTSRGFVSELTECYNLLDSELYIPIEEFGVNSIEVYIEITYTNIDSALMTQRFLLVRIDDIYDHLDERY